MENFLYSALKRATLSKDQTRIFSLGPYVAALGFIMSNLYKYR